MSIEAVCPPLNDKNEVGIPRQGRWTDMGPFVANHLAAGLAVGRDAALRDEVVAIPDVWAQVVVAAEALLDEHHPYHRVVEAQWRGLLALLALSAHHDLDLTIEIVSLGAAGVGGRGSLAERFSSLIREVAPRQTLLKEQNWSELGVIIFHDRPMGLIVPNILVCPARQRAPLHDSKVGWLERDCLADPCACSLMLKDDFAPLALYVANLIEKLEEMLSDRSAISSEETWGALLRELRNYLGDLERSQKLNRVDPEYRQVFTVGPYLGQPLRDPVYDLLRQVPSLGRDAGAGLSELILPFRADIHAEGGGGLLLAQGLETQWNLRPADVKLWRHFTLEHYGRLSGAEQEKVAEQASEKGFMIVRPEDLLTEELVCYPSMEFSRHPPGLESCLLPLRPLALLFLRPDNLRERLSLGRDGRLALTVDLLDAAGRARPYRIERDYRDRMVTQQEDILENRPLLWTWPSVDTGLPHHYHYHFSTHNNGLSTLHPFTPELARAYLGRRGGPSLRAAAAELAAALESGEGWQDPDAPVRVHYRQDGGRPTDEKARGLAWSEQHPETLICQIRDKGGKPGSTGLVLLPDTEAPHRRPAAYRVAMDLGSDNTTIYLRYDTHEPKPLSLGGRVQSAALQDQRSSLVDDQVLKDFLPYAAAEPPLPSLLLTRGTSLTGVRPLVDSRPWLAAARDYPVRNLLELETDGNKVWANLKWDRAQGQREGLGAFVEAASLLAVNEVVCQGGRPEEISWHFAYPGAIDDLDRYQSIQRKAVRRVLAPLLPEGQAERIQFSFAPESLAAARHFAEQDAQFQGTVITVDVGGSTSDIAIWQERRLLWQGSLKIGGHDVLNLVLANNLEALNAMAKKVKSPIYSSLENLEKRPPNDRQAYARLLNAVTLIVNSGQFAAMIAEAWDTHSGEYDFLPRYSGLFLAGLLTYLGRVTAALSERGAFDPRVKPVNLCLGGRGSLMFHTFCWGDKPLRATKNFAGEAMGMDEPVQVSLEPTKAKHEVARGLLLDDGGLDVGDLFPQMVLGEKLTLVSRRGEPLALSATSYWTRDHLAYDPKVEGLEGLDKLLADFNRHYGHELAPLTDEQKKLLAVDVESELKDNRNRIRGLTYEVERALGSMPPVSILALRFFLKRSFENRWS